MTYITVYIQLQNNKLPQILHISRHQVSTDALTINLTTLKLFCNYLFFIYVNNCNE